MFSFRIVLFLVLGHQYIAHGSSNICSQSLCEFELVIEHKRSMTYKSLSGFVSTYNVEWNTAAGRLQTVENSFRKAFDDPNIGIFVEAEDVITTDGQTRDMFVINGQFPGPALEVMEGCEVSVKVTNMLISDTFALHFHGVTLQNNVWMDGVQHVTQCPILPGQSFEYRFFADNPGTHWYHGRSRIDGIQGAFIVHEHQPTIPYHIVPVQDWMDFTATTLLLTNPYQGNFRGTGEGMLHNIDRDFSVDGNEVTAMRYVSTLIGGRGRNDDNPDPLPLSVHEVTPNGRHRFRMVNSGGERAYDVMIDSHKLHVKALDGEEIQPITVDSFQISPGERIDFEIDTDAAVGKYWMRAETVRLGKSFPIVEDGIIKGGLAIVKYEGAPNDDFDPTSERRVCTSDDPCVVFNCPFLGFRNDMHKSCLTPNDAESVHSDHHLKDEFGVGDHNVKRYFLNWGYHIGSSVNSRKFVHPTAPFSGDNDDNIVPCDDNECEQGCVCTNILELPCGRTIELVMSNLQDSQFIGHHTIHLHGYKFAVLGTGYPDFDSATGLWTQANQDVECNNDLCTQPSWRDEAPSFSTRPIVRDTVVVPSRGYTVIRFKSNNPGYWLLRCFHQSHFEEGMGMLINVGGSKSLPRPPKNFPTCGNFEWDRKLKRGKNYCLRRDSSRSSRDDSD